MLNITLEQWEVMSEPSREKVREYQAKYHMVQKIFLEKVNAEGREVTRLEFTPGPDFMNIPTYDVVTSLIKILDDVKSQDMTSEPPHTGREKRSLDQFTGEEK